MEELQQKTVKGFLTRHVTAVDIAAGIVIIFLCMMSVFFYLQAAQTRQELDALRSRETLQSTNKDVLAFTQLFIEKVLKAQGEIDFETRLNLESSVRALKDQEILKDWEAFTGSATEPEAQTAVKNLLGVLVSKIQ